MCHICVSTCVGEYEHPSEGTCILVCIINCGQELAYVRMAERVRPGPTGDWRAELFTDHSRHMGCLGLTEDMPSLLGLYRVEKPDVELDKLHGESFEGRTQIHKSDNRTQAILRKKNGEKEIMLI